MARTAKERESLLSKMVGKERAHEVVKGIMGSLRGQAPYQPKGSKRPRTAKSSAYAIGTSMAQAGKLGKKKRKKA